MRNRKLNRLPNFDYSSPGAYFVTICVHGREHVLGSVIDGVMHLTPSGKIAASCWQDLPNHYLNCRLDEFVIMPNHVHGIVCINEPVGNGLTGNGFKPFPTETPITTTIKKLHGLPEIIRGFKTFSSRRINEIRCRDRFVTDPHVFQWQKSYHDRIIRNEEELNRIRQYITENPANWQHDEENIRP